jgi:hypothetical protein
MTVATKPDTKEIRAFWKRSEQGLAWMGKRHWIEHQVTRLLQGYDLPEGTDTDPYIEWLWEHEPDIAREVQLASLLEAVMFEAVNAMIENGREYIRTDENFCKDIEQRFVDALKTKRMTL